MAIRMMTSKERFLAGEPNIEKISNYPGHVEGTISHSRSCPHFAGSNAGEELRPEGLFEDCLKAWDDPRRAGEMPCGGPRDALYMETTHVGLVLETREYNGRDDSDFYAVVWNPEKGATERVEYASTRGWTYPNNAVVDATPEVLEAFNVWSAANHAAAEAAAKLARDKALKEQIIAEAKVPRKGDKVVVVKGRKVKKGTEGECIWAGSGDWGPRVGLKDAAGTVHWMAAGNVERIGWEREVAFRLARAGLVG